MKSNRKHEIIFYVYITKKAIDLQSSFENAKRLTSTRICCYERLTCTTVRRNRKHEIIFYVYITKKAIDLQSSSENAKRLTSTRICCYERLTCTTVRRSDCK
ncbi:hypothetical protein PUN28_013954 [Cardiocondyla obscurior]|uniref:Uncharacterized protein n=1 Tax=Cardiocondyla obscurior TaxID=286306 RepID=A0AAW2F622_9HYME